MTVLFIRLKVCVFIYLFLFRQTFATEDFETGFGLSGKTFSSSAPQIIR